MIILTQQINDQIRDKEVRLIGQDGAQLGIVSGLEAQKLADNANLDLVKISPQAKPPVCKIMDYGKFRYEAIKKAKEAKKNQKVVEMKEIWLSATIDTNDLHTKAKAAQKFIEQGNRVRASIRLKGRQMAYPDLAVKIMEQFFEILKDIAQIEKKPSQEAKTIAMILVPITTIKK
ncbi:MAG: translation initiation factor IF-3 [Clostridia bacterium]